MNMTESATPESPPVAQTQAVAPVAPAAIPSTSGTGTLLQEVTSMKDTLGDRVEQLSVEIARMAARLTEAQRKSEEQTRENQKLVETVTYLRERAEATDQKMNESKKLGDVLTELLEAKLPVPSMIRLAQSWQPGQDLHEAVNHEREYLKKVLRESERGALEHREPSGLGLTESASFPASGSDSDLAEIRSLLAGGSY